MMLILEANMMIVSIQPIKDIPNVGTQRQIIPHIMDAIAKIILDALIKKSPYIKDSDIYTEKPKDRL